MLAAIPAPDHEHALFLGVVEDREQRAFGIDQHGDGSVHEARRNSTIGSTGTSRSAAVTRF
jgi:hypothetical protein